MLDAGMSVARLNMSHGTLAHQADVIAMLRAAQKQRRASCPPLAIAMDMKGPEVRLGNLDPAGPRTVRLNEGDLMGLTVDKAWFDKGTAKLMYLDYEKAVKLVEPGQAVYLDDGQLEVRVAEVVGDTIRCLVVGGGWLGSRKMVDMPGIVVDLPTLSEKDRRDLRFAVEQDVDVVVVTGMVRPAEVVNVRKLLGERGKHMLVVAKIDGRAGLREAGGLIRVADGVMVARCGLEMEMSPGKVSVL